MRGAWAQMRRARMLSRPSHPLPPHPWPSHTALQFNGQSLQPDFMAINPNSAVPVLVVGDAAPITESRAIVEAADRMREGGPLGGDAVNRALLGTWMDKIGTHSLCACLPCAQR